MPSFTSKPRKIRDALVSIISGIQLNGEQAFQIVTGDPAKEFDSEPYALVFPGEITSQTSMAAQRDRTVNFEVMVLLNLEDGSRTQNATYNYMYDLTDLIMSTLEEGDHTSALNTVDPTLGTWIMETSRGAFYPADTKSGSALLCTISVAITYAIAL